MRSRVGVNAHGGMWISSSTLGTRLNWKDGVMGIQNQYGMTHFHCEVCAAEFIEETGDSYDEARLAAIRAKEFGWRLSNRRGRWQALCPECASFTGYAMGPEALP